MLFGIKITDDEQEDDEYKPTAEEENQYERSLQLNAKWKYRKRKQEIDINKLW